MNVWPRVRMTCAEFEAMPIYNIPPLTRVGLHRRWRHLHSWTEHHPDGPRVFRQWWIAEYGEWRHGSATDYYIRWMQPILRIPAKTGSLT